jgi:FkbM family methyltransferase
MQPEIVNNGRSVKIGDILSSNDGDICNAFLTTELIWKYRDKYNALKFLDIGFDKGWWSLLVSSLTPESEIIGFEPNPVSFNAATQIIINHPNIILYNIALSNSSGVLKLSLEEGSSNSRNNEGVEVPCNTIDKYIADNEIISIVKIDTEGHEPYIIESMQTKIGNKTISSIILEYTVFWYGMNISDCLYNGEQLLNYLINTFRSVYALSRNGSPFIVGPVSIKNSREFVYEHYMRHLQTDLLCTDQDIETVPVFSYEANKYYA